MKYEIIYDVAPPFRKCGSPSRYYNERCMLWRFLKTRNQKHLIIKVDDNRGFRRAMNCGSYDYYDKCNFYTHSENTIMVVKKDGKN